FRVNGACRAEPGLTAPRTGVFRLRRTDGDKRVPGPHHPPGSGVPEVVRVAAEATPAAAKATGMGRLACATGEWPSGKAADSGSANRRFESYLPSQVCSQAQLCWCGLALLGAHRASSTTTPRRCAFCGQRAVRHQTVLTPDFGGFCSYLCSLILQNTPKAGKYAAMQYRSTRERLTALAEDQW